METLYITFEVSVSDREYYGGKKGSAEIKMQIPRVFFLEFIDPDNLFLGIMQVALADFDAFDASEKEAE